MIAVSGLQRHYKRFRDADAEARVFLIRRRYFPTLLLFSLFPLRLLLAALLRAALLGLKPFVHIRFGRYFSSSLGRWGFAMEMYLCERDAGWHPRRALDYFYHWSNTQFLLKSPRVKKICNQQLHIMLKRNLRVSQFAAGLDHLNRMLSRGHEQFTVQDTGGYNEFSLLERFPPHLAFTEEEEQRGISGLRDLGIEPDSRFVCFHARDGDFIKRDTPRMTSLYGEWDTADWRDASIENYLPAVDELARRGYYAIRMGKLVKDALKQDNPRVIDYATQYHSDFMDVFLSARCAFFIGQNSGMITLPTIFRRPMAMANVMAFHAIAVADCPDTIFIPKKYYSAKLGRLLTFREILADPRLLWFPGKGYDNPQAYHDSIGLEILENSPEEITELAIEVDQEIRGTFDASLEDHILQQRFLAIVSPYAERLFNGRRVLESPRCLRIGSHFLRVHPELLE